MTISSKNLRENLDARYTIKVWVVIKGIQYARDVEGDGYHPKLGSASV